MGIVLCLLFFIYLLTSSIISKNVKNDNKNTAEQYLKYREKNGIKHDNINIKF